MFRSNFLCCEACGLATFTHDTLKIHTLMHCGYSFRCSGCSSAYTSIHLLLHHLVHCTETRKPDQQLQTCYCQKCGLKFDLIAGLICHTRLEHEYWFDLTISEYRSVMEKLRYVVPTYNKLEK